MKFLFWFLILLVFYTYVGYGIILFLLVRIKGLFRARLELASDFFPGVTLVVPAYNEEDCIAKKAQNCRELNYPEDQLRILFITDGSNDRTVEILRDEPGVELSHSERRAGKSAAKNSAMTLVETDYVVFSDAHTLLNPDCIKNLVRHYREEKVGAVSGEKRVMSSEAYVASAAGEGLYWCYESALKRWGSELYTVVGAIDKLTSFRSSLWQDLEEDTILDDFIQTLRICEKGYRVVYEPEAFAAANANDDPQEDLKRKIRIAAGGWQAMARLQSLLNFFAHPLLSFQYISHRFLRWSFSAFALPIIFVINLVLYDQGPTYQLLMWAQLAFYISALVGWALENREIRLKLLFVPYYFLKTNYAVFAGFGRWLGGSKKANWMRAKRARS